MKLYLDFNDEDLASILPFIVLEADGEVTTE